MDKKPHSADHFGEQRNFWWNKDFVELMAKRWHLSNVRKVLDVGCGIGHWGQMLSQVLPKNAQIFGIDREQEWVESAQARVKGHEDRFQYSHGLVEAIPFADETFDMVTCQTVLIHVGDIGAVLKEMYRVLKPSGLLVVAEPNNCASELIFDSISVNDPVDDIVSAIHFQLTCERGKASMGLGFESAGDTIPAYFKKLALNDIQVYLSDKTTPFIPPYDDDEQQIWIKQTREWVDEDILLWGKAETKRYFLAGGGAVADFEPRWKFLQQRWRRCLKAIDNKTYATAGANVLYLISGRKSK